MSSSGTPSWTRFHGYRLITLYAGLSKLAMKNNQLVSGEYFTYYVTLEQLEQAIRDEALAEDLSGDRTVGGN